MAGACPSALACISVRACPCTAQAGLVLVAMQLLPRGSLNGALRDPDARAELRWGARGRQIALDVAEALVFLHTRLRVLHSDIKAANVLLGQDWRAHLSDLGLSQVIANTARTALGFSCTYAAPEQLMGQRCTLAADMYRRGRRGRWERACSRAPPMPCCTGWGPARPACL